MKKFKIFAFAALAGIGVSLAACDDNIPSVDEFEQIALTDVDLDPSLSRGVVMEINTTMSVAGMVTLTPVDASERAENFYSSDPNVATVNGMGEITANAVGDCVITISVGGFDVDFPLEVIPFLPIHITDMTLTSEKVILATAGIYSTFDMMSTVRLVPGDANDGLEFTVTGTEGVVNVSETGVISCVAAGTTSVTVTSTYDETMTKTLEVEVLEVTLGNYERAAWTMTTSQNPLPNVTDCGQGLGSALDGDPATNLALIRPGKNSAGVNLSGQAGSVSVWFVIDMGTEQYVNSYEIVHRVGPSVIQTRFWGFDEISGSNDGVNFTTIATASRLPTTYPAANDGVADITELSHSAMIPLGPKYRYIKFNTMSANCFYQYSYTSNGNAVQIQELYLGVK